MTRPVRKAITSTLAVVTLLLAAAVVSAPAAVADDPVQITSAVATPSTVDLAPGVDGQVGFTVQTSSGTNAVTSVTAVIHGVLSGGLTSTDGTSWSGALTVPWDFKSGSYGAVVTAIGGGGEQAVAVVPIVLRGTPTLTLAVAPLQVSAGGSYLVQGSIKENNSGAAPRGLAASLRLRGPGYDKTFTVGATGTFHHAVTNALPATWTVDFLGDATHLPAHGSFSVLTTPNPTRIVSFDAGPEPAYLFGVLTVTGYLQRRSPVTGSWVGYAGQQVRIARTTPGPYARLATTGAGGRFSVTIRGDGVMTAVWHASFAGRSTGSVLVNAGSNSLGDSVAVIAPPLRITRVYYDVPGSDTPITNTKLNQEYVRITNVGHITFDLYRYVLLNYEFSTLLLGPGQSVVVHTGQGANSATNRYMGLGNYVWSNTGGTAVFRAYVTNQTVDSCTWGDGIGYTNC